MGHNGGDSRYPQERDSMIVHLETKADQRFPATKSMLVIGRDEVCDLRSKSRSVSRKHCAIIQKNDRVFAKDLNSRNGTYVNNQRIAPGGHVELFHFDEVRAGKLVVRVSIVCELTELPHVRTFEPDSEEKVEFKTAESLQVQPNAPGQTATTEITPEQAANAIAESEGTVEDSVTLEANNSESQAEPTKPSESVGDAKAESVDDEDDSNSLSAVTRPKEETQGKT